MQLVRMSPHKASKMANACLLFIGVFLWYWFLLLLAKELVEEPTEPSGSGIVDRDLDSWRIFAPLTPTPRLFFVLDLLIPDRPGHVVVRHDFAIVSMGPTAASFISSSGREDAVISFASDRRWLIVAIVGTPIAYDA